MFDYFRAGGRCRKADLPLSDESSLSCDDDFRGNATRCTGSFTCPPNFISMG